MKITKNVAIKLNELEAEQEAYKKFKEELKQIRTKNAFIIEPKTDIELKTLNTFKQVFNKCIEQNKINKLNEQLNKLLNILQ